jgi:DNA repair protein RadC
LELLLFMAIPRTDVKPLAKALVDRFGSFADVIAVPVERLKKFGLTDNTIAAVKVVEAGSLRLARAKVIDRPALSSWEALLDYCASAMGRLETEEFHVLFLDRTNALIADERLQKGTVDHTPVYPREVMKRALELNASALILVHNHPSGDPTPQRRDQTAQRGDIGIFSNDEAIRRLVGAILLEQNDEWAVQRGRYMSLGAMIPSSSCQRWHPDNPANPAGDHDGNAVLTPRQGPRSPQRATSVPFREDQTFGRR